MCSSIQCEESSNQPETNMKTKSFEHSLDSIENEFRNNIQMNIESGNEIRLALFNNPLHINENNDTLTSNGTEELTKTTFASSVRQDHDYETIKKSDDNLLIDESANDLSINSSNQELVITESLIETTEALSKSEIKNKSLKTTVLSNLFNSDSNQYSLLNTKIAEESENDDESNEDKLGKDKADLMNKFGYLKLYDQSSQDFKSVSLREPTNVDLFGNQHAKYLSTSFSYPTSKVIFLIL